MRTLITGATGYLGAQITRHLYSVGHETIAWCRYLDASKRQQLEKFTNRIIIGDILDDDAMQAAILSGPEIIIHLVSLNQKDSEINICKTGEVNVLSTWNLLEAFKSSHLSKFVYLSTIQVLGNLKTGIIDENYSPGPQNTYALSHLLSEQVLNYYVNKAGFHPVILRLANGYGSPVFKDNNCWNLVVNDLCRMAYSEKKIVLQSDGSPLRDFIHVKDISRAVELLIGKPNDSLAPLYNLASSQTFSILELALLIKQIYRQKYKLDLPIYTPSGEFSHNQLSAEPAKYKLDSGLIEQLGFKPALSIEDGINELLNYFEYNN